LDLPERIVADAADIVGEGDPLLAEQWASITLGSRYGRPLDLDDIRAVIRSAVTGYLFGEPSPAMLAALLALAVVAPEPAAAELAAAAVLLRSVGGPAPAWAEQIGDVELVGCWRLTDAVGDFDGLNCAFRYQGRPPHMLFFCRDPNRGNAGVDAWISYPADELVAKSDDPPGASTEMTLIRIDAAETHAHIATSVTIGDLLHNKMATDTYMGHRALTLARLRVFPPAADLLPPQAWDLDRQRATHEEFLASDEAAAFIRDTDPDTLAEEPADILAACVLEYFRFSCEDDPARLLRVSPRKCEMFLLGWLPNETVVFDGVLGAIPDALTAFARWAARRNGLSTEALASIVDAIRECAPQVLDAYAKPAPEGTLRHMFESMLEEGLDPFDDADREAWEARHRPAGD
jgi:hypothetical protein